MPYLIDRQRVLWMNEVLGVVRATQRRFKSRVILTDNSLYQTLTKPATLMRYAREYPNLKGATWRKPQ